MKFSDFIAGLSSEHDTILGCLNILYDAVRGDGIQFMGVQAFLDFTHDFAEPHHKKEEKILFPAMEAAGVKNIGGPIGAMISEHQKKRMLIATLQKACDEMNQIEIAKVALQIVILLSRHIQKEEMVLYPLANRLIGKNEVDA